MEKKSLDNELLILSHLRAMIQVKGLFDILGFWKKENKEDLLFLQKFDYVQL